MDTHGKNNTGIQKPYIPREKYHVCMAKTI